MEELTKNEKKVLIYILTQTIVKITEELIKQKIPESIVKISNLDVTVEDLKNLCSKLQDK